MSVNPLPRASLRFDFFEQARQVSLLDILNKYLPQVDTRQVNGKLYLRCPFHSNGNEKTPSLHIDPCKNLWHCFGCGEGGDSIDLVERLLNTSPLEAAKNICQEFSLNPNELTTTEQQRRKREREVKMRQIRQERELEQQCVAYLRYMHSLRKATELAQQTVNYSDNYYNLLEVLLDELIERLTSFNKDERFQAIKEAEGIWNRWHNIAHAI